MTLWPFRTKVSFHDWKGLSTCEHSAPPRLQRAARVYDETRSLSSPASDSKLEPGPRSRHRAAFAPPAGSGHAQAQPRRWRCCRYHPCPGVAPEVSAETLQAGLWTRSVTGPRQVRFFKPTSDPENHAVSFDTS